MTLHRRDWLRLAILGVLGADSQKPLLANETGPSPAPLKITGLKVTPIALPDPPLLNASGCHGPYFLRNIIEIETDGKIVGVGETNGGERIIQALEKARKLIVGHNAFAYRELIRPLMALNPSCYAGVEIACLDAVGRATGRRLCELIGGPVRDPVEFAAYLFYRYAADHPTILADPHLADARGRGDKAIDSWGEVRSPQAMADMAKKFRDRWGFRVFKLKGGVLSPELERDTLNAMNATLGKNCPLRIDPNGRWRLETAARIGKTLTHLPLEYYEDPVLGQAGMADIRKATGLKMSTNMCVTRFDHLPEAFRLKPIDVLLTDLHYWGGFAGNLALGPIADAAGWVLSQHSNNHAGITMAAMIHLASALPQLTSASDTHYPWLPDDADIIEGPKIPIKNGKMSVPSGPGLGVRLDRDKLALGLERYNKSGVRGRDDASLMRRLEPGWTGGLL